MQLPQEENFCKNENYFIRISREEKFCEKKEIILSKTNNLCPLSSVKSPAASTLFVIESCCII